MAKPHSGMAQTPMLAKWGVYLQHWSTLSISPLWAELQEVLGPDTYVGEKSTAPVPIEEMEASPFHEGQAPIPSDAWYTDGSSRGQPARWTAIAIQSETDTIWFDTGMGQSSQWVELQAVWLMATNEALPLTIYTDSWAVYWGANIMDLYGMQINVWLCIGHYGDRPCGKTYGS